MISPSFALSDLQKDALKEVGNIGAGHAATALSQLLNTRISLDEPSFDVVPFGQVGDRFDPTQEVAALRMQIRGEIPGQMFVFFDHQQALDFTTKFLRRVVGEIQVFDSIVESTLKEFANIIGGAYITALISLTTLDMRPSVPSLLYGTFGDALSSFGDIDADAQVMLIQSRFGDGAEQEIFGRVFLIPDGDAVAKLLEPFGV